MLYLILLIVGITWACSPEAGVHSTIVRDSAGVRIVENPAHASLLDIYNDAILNTTY